MTNASEAPLKEQILEYSRQKTIGELSPWFDKELERQIQLEFFLDPSILEGIADRLEGRLRRYRAAANIENVVIGMSGGVDSALTAALFKRAGWHVIGVTMPIHQNPEETDRGAEACEALGIEYRHIDLTQLYDQTLDNIGFIPGADPALNVPGWKERPTPKSVLIRRGNVRARLRMITLYNLASLHSGLVASTDNFSELSAGFWTLHGDVGDVSPIQGLNKSWEVPYIASVVGVPEATWRAKPTDGLGIDVGDEAQLGCSYLEWDLMVNKLIELGSFDTTTENELNGDDRALSVFVAVSQRMKASWFKRKNPFNFDHPILGNIKELEEFEENNTVPKV